jgi:hypothetical protein
MYVHLHSSTTHNNQEVEAVQMSINDEWISKLGCIPTVIIFSHEQTDIYYHISETAKALH